MQELDYTSLPQDCTCNTHSGRHWLHMDMVWHEKNRKLLATANDASVDSVKRWLALVGFEKEELQRLQEKQKCMEQELQTFIK